MKDLIKRFTLGLSVIAVAGATLIYGGSVVFGEDAQAQVSGGDLPTECRDDPELNWRCVVISRDEPGFVAEAFEANCIQPRMLAPFDIDGKGRVLSYVMVGRVIEGCLM